MKNFSLSKKVIIKKKDFINVLNNNICIKLNFIQILYKHNILNYSRIGFLVKKKNIKLSINRNKFRRIIKEFFRLNNNNINNIDIIFLSNRIIKNLYNNLLLIELDYIFNFLIKKDNILY